MLSLTLILSPSPPFYPSRHLTWRRWLSNYRLNLVLKLSRLLFYITEPTSLSFSFSLSHASIWLLLTHLQASIQCTNSSGLSPHPLSSTLLLHMMSPIKITTVFGMYHARKRSPLNLNFDHFSDPPPLLSLLHFWSFTDHSKSYLCRLQLCILVHWHFFTSIISLPCLFSLSVELRQTLTCLLIILLETSMRPDNNHSVIPFENFTKNSLFTLTALPRSNVYSS